MTSLSKYIFALLLLLHIPSFSAGANDLKAQADSAYTAEDYPQALALYQQLVTEEGTSAELLYNLGNTFYRMGKPAQAILNYERALRINPAMSDARHNLELVNNRIIDRPGERGTFMGNALDTAARVMSADAWAWLTFGLFAAALGCVCLYLFTTGVMLRKTGFFCAIGLFVLTLIGVVFTLRSARLATDRNQAIVTTASSILSTSPRAPKDRSEEAMLLHEGTRVTILDSVASPGTDALWYDVEVDNEHRAWINSADVEII